MKKIVTLLLLIGLMAFSLPGIAKDVKGKKEISTKESDIQQAQESQKIDLTRDNPIDRAFAKDFQTAQVTPEINYVNEEYLNAWKAEMSNVSTVVKKSFANAEDGKRVDEYVADYENLINKAFDLEMLNWISDPAESIASRSFGTGGPGAAMLAQGRIYKQATLNLIAHYEANPEVKYKFVYNGKGADLEKLREQK